MKARQAFCQFIDDLRTLLLNVYYYDRRAKLLKTVNWACSLGIVVLICVGLVFSAAGRHGTALVLQIAAAVVALGPIVSPLQQSVLRYASLRDEYRALYLEARTAHNEVTRGALTIGELVTIRSSLLKRQRALADREDVPGPAVIRRLQKRVNDALSSKYLWPDHFQLKEEEDV